MATHDDGDPKGSPATFGVALPAAGSGLRMGGARKAFLTLAGEPILLRSLRPFLEHPDSPVIAVALPPEEFRSPPKWLSGLAPRVRLTEGGATRLHSVHAALSRLPEELEVILIHDAARPLVTRESIDRCIQVASGGDGAVAGWPAVDTLQEVDEDGFIRRTPVRDSLWHAQTPQAFPGPALRQAYARAVEEELSATDDAAVFSAAGGPVRMVRGARWNLKITHPEDLELAAFLLERQGRDGVRTEGAGSGIGSRPGRAPLPRIRWPREDSAAARAADHLRRGGLLLYPTETVYGLGARVTQEGVQAVARLKGREAGRPILALIHWPEGDNPWPQGGKDSPAMKDPWTGALRWSPAARSLARAFWPGPLTLVLPAQGNIWPRETRNADDGVGIRASSHPFVQGLTRELGEPILSSSANPSGTAPSPDPDRVEAAFHARGDLVAGLLSECLLVDGGVLPPSRPSTVVDCTSETPRILRPGAVTPDELRAVTSLDS